eukprot:TRINITY_DN5172_c0_g2_i1.p1 TRINITY_DN5172_c0_g2~~TRINITY_DN5172_c0_g2_i1.p1  ORF type:complete len:317 (+),score=57.34 TRINITY_DN5172_c0_g2_i1:49-951(+)
MSGSVPLHPLARIRLGKSSGGWGWWLAARGLQGSALYLVLYAGYCRSSMMEGGIFSRHDAVHLSQDHRLTDWYFHLLKKEGTGFLTSFQYQAAIPPGKEYDDDEVLTEFARSVMGSWVRTLEKRERGLDEPLDVYSDADLASCMFRPPSGFDNIKMGSAEQREFPWWKKILGFKETEKVAAPSEGEFIGDTIGGYFAHRREGLVNNNARKQLGGADANQICGRSLVLSPDPWEERTYVLSVSPGNGYCTLRLHYATSSTSQFFPDASNYGLFYRTYVKHRNRWLLSSAGRDFERKYAKKA